MEFMKDRRDEQHRRGGGGDKMSGYDPYPISFQQFNKPGRKDRIKRNNEKRNPQTEDTE